MRQVRRFLLTYGLLTTIGFLEALALTGCSDEPLPTGSEGLNSSRSIVDEFFQAPTTISRDAGIVVGIFTPAGREIYSYGNSGNEGRPGLDSNTVFEIGSITKLFTALALADLVERKELNLNHSIDLYLPDSLITGGVGSQITLLDLATHTSGLPDQPEGYTFQQGYSEEQMYSDLRRHLTPGGTSPDSLPIQREYNYSNFGMGLLGHILERRTGLEYENIIVSRICDPLNMASTRIQLSNELAASLAFGMDGKGSPTPQFLVSSMEGFGSFRSTVGDLLTFISANLGQTETALLPAMKLTHLKHRSAENRFIPGWVGLGWQIIDNHGTLVLDHSGETWGYVSYVGFIEYARVGVVVLANFLDGTVQIKGFRLLERLAEQFGD